MSGAGYEEARREKEAGVDTDLPTLPQNAIIILIFFKLFHICQPRLFNPHLKDKLNVIRLHRVFRTAC